MAYDSYAIINLGDLFEARKYQSNNHIKAHGLTTCYSITNDVHDTYPVMIYRGFIDGDCPLIFHVYIFIGYIPVHLTLPPAIKY